MELKHVALSICASEDIREFYETILGMEKVRESVLDRSLTKVIFGIDQDTPVSLYRKNAVFFEIFVVDQKQTASCDHICLAFDDRKAVFEKAQQAGYTAIHELKGTSQIFFIKDKRGNTFELKDKA